MGEANFLREFGKTVIFVIFSARNRENGSRFAKKFWVGLILQFFSIVIAIFLNCYCNFFSIVMCGMCGGRNYEVGMWCCEPNLDEPNLYERGDKTMSNLDFGREWAWGWRACDGWGEWEWDVCELSSYYQQHGVPVCVRRWLWRCWRVETDLEQCGHWSLDLEGCIRLLNSIRKKRQMTDWREQKHQKFIPTHHNTSMFLKTRHATDTHTRIVWLVF